MSCFRISLISLSIFILAGCQPLSGSRQGKPFAIASVMKSDLHILVEVHQRQTLGYLRELTEKLYRRNPRELRKVAGATIETRLAELFPVESGGNSVQEGPDDQVSQPGKLLGRVTSKASGITLLSQAFDEQYQGDRVLALVSGIRNMVMTAYNGQVDFYYLDKPLDPQKLHNSARNVEIVIWRLSHESRADGQPWLLSNSLGPDVNLSFERLFGKLIGQLDMIALMVAQQRNIQIKNLMRSVASMVFLPV